jgi:hypothetical protein
MGQNKKRTQSGGLQQMTNEKAFKEKLYNVFNIVHAKAMTVTKIEENINVSFVNWDTMWTCK